MPKEKKKILAMKVAPYTLINRFLYKLGPDEILQRCVLEHEILYIIDETHNGFAGGHYQDDTTARKILQPGLWWPTLNKYCQTHIRKCDEFQRCRRL